MSYYRSYFVTAMPKLHGLIDWICDIEDTQFVKQTPNMSTTLKGVTRTLGGLEQSVTKRFNKFDKQVVVNWDMVTMDTEQVRRTILGHHASLAEVLCGLMVKVYEWEDKFPSGGGSPDRRCDLISAGLRDGLDRSPPGRTRGAPVLVHDCGLGDCEAQRLGFFEIIRVSRRRW